MKRPNTYWIEQGSQTIVVACCLFIAIYTETRWLSVLNAMAAGFNLGAVVYRIMLERMHKLFRDTVGLNRQLSELNQVLIQQNRVILHFDRDHPPPPRPTMN